MQTSKLNLYRQTEKCEEPLIALHSCSHARRASLQPKDHKSPMVASNSIFRRTFCPLSNFTSADSLTSSQFFDGVRLFDQQVPCVQSKLTLQQPVSSNKLGQPHHWPAVVQPVRPQVGQWPAKQLPGDLHFSVASTTRRATHECKRCAPPFLRLMVGGLKRSVDQHQHQAFAPRCRVVRNHLKSIYIYIQSYIYTIHYYTHIYIYMSKQRGWILPTRKGTLKPFLA